MIASQEAQQPVLGGAGGSPPPVGGDGRAASLDEDGEASLIEHCFGIDVKSSEIVAYMAQRLTFGQ